MNIEYIVKRAFKAGYIQGVGDERWGGYNNDEDAFVAWINENSELLLALEINHEQRTTR